MVGRPLFTWVLTEAIFSNLDTIYVYTDDEEIIGFIEKEYFWTDKVKPVLRPDDTATDTASTEQGILQFCNAIDNNFDLFCLLQATSPFTTKTSINEALTKIQNESYDSALSVVKTHRFTWSSDGEPQNYDVFNRPRRQDFKGLLIENGAIYCTTKSALQSSKNRVSGRIAMIEMLEESYHEVDSESDWLVVEQLLIERQKRLKKTKLITHLVLDVDGVFTAGTITYDKYGELSKEFDMRDGMGLEILRQNGIEVIIMTSEQSDIVAQRMGKLKINHVCLGVKDKYALLQQLSQQQNFNLSNVAYIGDDVNDLTNICSVGWSFAPYNAMTIVKQHADVVLTQPSAQGAIRETCEFILNYNKRFQ